MKRSYIYLIVVLLTISLVYADFIISKDLKKIIPLDDTYRTIEGDIPGTKEASVYTSLTIQNEQSSDEKVTYDYTIKINEVSGAIRANYNGNEKYVLFSANGEAKFQLKSNESIVLYEVPVGSSYKINQVTNNNKYTVKVGSNVTRTYESVINEDTSITFNNSLKNRAVPAKDTSNQEKKIPKKEIPNTSETEIKMVLVLIISILVIWCFRRIKVKRFE